MAAITPAPALTVPAIVAQAKIALSNTLSEAGRGTYSATNCHKTARRYGACHFVMTLKSKSGKTFKCEGTINIRNIGHGYEKSYGVVYCDGKKV